MQTDLTQTIPYYIYSHLQELQDLYDERIALVNAKENAIMAGAMPEDINEFDWELEMLNTRIAEVKMFAN